uniref:transposase n=1 Tax=Burkholderia cepacia TaxID=292 RepID=UPI001FC7D2F1
RQNPRRTSSARVGTRVPYGCHGFRRAKETAFKKVKRCLRIAQIKALPDGAQKDLMIALERTKAQIRARVEHPFHVVKNLFRHRKVRYKGLLKNTAQLFSLFALANLVIARNRLRSIHGRSPSSV